MSLEILPPDHTDESVLIKSVSKVKDEIDFDGIYYHYKDPSKFYKIVAVSLLEATEEIAIVYQALYGHQLVWVRAWSNWNESVEVQGKLYRRFQRKEKG